MTRADRVHAAALKSILHRRTTKFRIDIADAIAAGIEEALGAEEPTAGFVEAYDRDKALKRIVAEHAAILSGLAATDGGAAPERSHDGHEWHVDPKRGNRCRRCDRKGAIDNGICPGSIIPDEGGATPYREAVALGARDFTPNADLIKRATSEAGATPGPSEACGCKLVASDGAVQGTCVLAKGHADYWCVTATGTHWNDVSVFDRVRAEGIAQGRREAFDATIALLREMHARRWAASDTNQCLTLEAVETSILELAVAKKGTP